MKPLLVTFVLATTLCAQQPAAEPHTFTATDGRKLTATIVSKSDSAVTIRRAEDGKEFVLPLDRVSAEDRAFVKAWVAPSPSPTSPPAAPPTDEVKQALDDARKYAAAGEYAKALERHEWFHENSREVSGMGGVRLSYALADWMALGEKHPPAIQSLKAIRDDNAKTLVSGSGTVGLFHDFRGINRALSKPDTAAAIAGTLRLFRQLDASQPELAERCFGVVVEDLIATNDTELFVKYAGDLKSYLNQAVERHVDEAKWAKGRSYEAEHIQFLDKRLKKLTDFMSQIAESKGDAPLAEELRAMTAEVVTTSPAPAPVPAPVPADPALPESWVVPPKYAVAQDFVRLPGATGPMFATFQENNRDGTVWRRGSGLASDKRLGLIRSDGLVLCDPEKGESLPPDYFWAPGFNGPKNTAHYFRNHRVLPKLSGGKWGLVDVDGVQVVPPQWDRIGAFSEGLFSFCVPGKNDKDAWGYANLKGEVVIQPQWAEARPFSGGYALVTVDRKWSVIDKAGKVISDEVWDHVQELGAYKIPVIPDHVSMFDYHRPAEFRPGVFWVSSNQKWGLYDFAKNALLGELEWDEGGHRFRDGRSWVLKDGKYGMIDLAGKMVLEPLWESERPGTPPVRAGNFVKAARDGKTAWWRIDGTRSLPEGDEAEAVNPYRGSFQIKIENGKLIRIEKDFSNEESTRMVIKRGGRIGLADLDGQLLKEPLGTSSMEISSTPSPDYFLVDQYGDRHGLIDAMGEEVEPLSLFENIPLDSLEITDSALLPDGEIVAAFRGSELRRISDALFIKTKGGIVKVPWKAPEIQKAPGTVTVRRQEKDGKWGYIHLSEAKP